MNYCNVNVEKLINFKFLQDNKQLLRERYDLLYADLYHFMDLSEKEIKNRIPNFSKLREYNSRISAINTEIDSVVFELLDIKK